MNYFILESWCCGCCLAWIEPEPLFMLHLFLLWRLKMSAVKQAWCAPCGRRKSIDAIRIKSITSFSVSVLLKYYIWHQQNIFILNTGVEKKNSRLQVSAFITAQRWLFTGYWHLRWGFWTFANVSPFLIGWSNYSLCIASAHRNQFLQMYRAFSLVLLISGHRNVFNL